MGNSCTKEFQIKSSTIALDNIEKEKVLTRKTTLSVNSYGLTLIDISKDDTKNNYRKASEVSELSKSVNLNISDSMYKNLKLAEFFIELLINEFNQARTNPKEYSNKIHFHTNFIRKEGDNMYYVEKYGIKIKLHSQKQGFIECAEFLSNSEPIPPLAFNKDLVIEVPNDRSEQLDKEAMVEKALNKKKQLFSSKMTFGFHFDKGSINPETSCVLQLVDDSCKTRSRRNNIMNNNFNQVGVAVRKVNFKKAYIIYVTFSGKLLDS